MTAELTPSSSGRMPPSEAVAAIKANLASRRIYHASLVKASLDGMHLESSGHDAPSHPASITPGELNLNSKALEQIEGMKGLKFHVAAVDGNAMPHSPAKELGDNVRTPV